MALRLKARVSTDGNIRALANFVGEQIDGVAVEKHKKLRTLEKELAGVHRRLDTTHNLAETSEVDMADCTTSILQHRERQERLEYSAEQVRTKSSHRQSRLPPSAFTISSASCRVISVRLRSVLRTTSSLGRLSCRSQVQSA